MGPKDADSDKESCDPAHWKPHWVEAAFNL